VTDGTRAAGPEPAEGDGIVKASMAGTVAFALSAGLAAVRPAAAPPALVVAGVLFVGGMVTFAGALVRAAGRSRTEAVHLAGVFFVAGAPKRVRLLLLGSLAAEVVVAFATAAARPNTSLAFGILAPVWAQGLAGLWGARHGRFPPRPQPRPRSAPPARRPSGPSPIPPVTPAAPPPPPPPAAGNGNGTHHR
jgi:hypothetical protein